MKALCALVLAAGVAHADSSVAAAPAASAPTPGLDLHDAARFVATAFRLHVAVVGAGEHSYRGRLPDDPKRALEAIVSGAGVEIVRDGRLTLIGPREIVARARGATDGPPGKRMQVDFHGASGDNLMHLLADVSKLKREGHMTGAVSLKLELGALAMARLVGKLAGSPVRVAGGVLRYGGELPPAPPEIPERCTSPGDLKPMTVTKLVCVPVDDLEALAIVKPSTVAWAAIRARHTPRGFSPAFVRVGDLVGNPPTRIVEIADDAVILDGARALRLSPQKETP